MVKAKSKSKSNKKKQPSKKTKKNSAKKNTTKLNDKKTAKNNKTRPPVKKPKKETKKNKKCDQTVEIVEENVINEIVINLEDEKELVSQEITNDIDDVSLLMECITSDDDTQHSLAKIENADDNTNFMDDLKIDIDINEGPVLAEELMKMNCFVDLQQLMVNDNSISNSSSDVFQINLGNENDIGYDQVKSFQSEEVINCVCGYREEDGLMIQCDICLTWQHAMCCGMNNDSDVPESYMCVYCAQPKNIRPSQMYLYARHFLTLSKLPKFSRRTCKENVLMQREELLRDSFKLTADLRKINKMMRTVTTKISIAEEPDHPKLYMWSANWDSPVRNPIYTEPDHDSDLSIDGPVGERPIESADCQLRLLHKIESDQKDLALRLSLINNELQQLDPDWYTSTIEEKNLKKVIRQITMDLKTVQTAASIS